MQMQQQKVDHYLGNFQIMGLLSYGSTSHVFKVMEVSKQDIQSKNKINRNDIQLIRFNMNMQKNQPEQCEANQNQTKKQFILKLYNLDRMLNKQNQFLSDIKFDIFLQILISIYMNHPGIVKAKQLILQYKNIKQNISENLCNKKLAKVGIIMEICQKGCFNSLINYINRTKKLKDNKVKILKFYFAQIANTLIYLNSKCKVIHRDIKVQNIMINKQLDIKIIDYGVSTISKEYLQKIFTHPQKQILFNLFGFSRQITPMQLAAQLKFHEKNRKNMIGSKHYISPQLVQKYRSDIEMISQAQQKTDIWSFGVLLYKCFHDCYPFEGRNIRQTLQLIANEDEQASIRQDLPDDAKEIIRRCLVKDYEQRADWQQIRKMRFFSQMPLDVIFDIQSPIIELLQEDRQKNRSKLSLVKNIVYDQFLLIKYQNQLIRKRRLIITKQGDEKNIKIVGMKEKQSIAFQIQITNNSNLSIENDQKQIGLKYTDQKFQNQCITIVKNCQYKEKLQKIIDLLLLNISSNINIKQNKLQKLLTHKIDSQSLINFQNDKMISQQQLFVNQEQINTKQPMK